MFVKILAIFSLLCYDTNMNRTYVLIRSYRDDLSIEIWFGMTQVHAEP